MYSVQIQVSDGTLKRVEVSIEYASNDDIQVYIGESETPLVSGTDYLWDGKAIVFPTAWASGTTVLVRRHTPIDEMYNQYDGGAAFNRTTLDQNFLQILYLAQEFTEGAGIQDIYRNISMHGFRIREVGTPVDDGDAVNKLYVDLYNDTQDQRLEAVESGLQAGNNSIPWRYVTTAATSTLSPNYTFRSALLYLNGVAQTYGTAYTVANNVITLAESIPAGVEVFAVLGQSLLGDMYIDRQEFEAEQARMDTKNAAQDASISSLSTALTALQSRVSTAESDITSLKSRASALETRATNVESRATSLESRSTALESRATAIETKNTSQDTSIATLTTNLALAGGANYVYNPSFDVAGSTAGLADGWVGQGSATATRSLIASTLKGTGTAQRVTSANLSATVYSELALATNRRVLALPGEQYTLSAYMNMTAGCRYELYLIPYNSSGTQLVGAGAGATATGAWQRVSVTATMPANTASVTVFLRLVGTASIASGSVDWDDVQIERAPTMSGWRDNALKVTIDQAATAATVATQGTAIAALQALKTISVIQTTSAATTSITVTPTFDNAAVFIQGVIQTKDVAYSVSGKTFTFAESVPAGYEVVILLFNATS